MNIRTLRWLALVGLGIVMLVDSVLSLRAGSGWVLGVVTFVVFLVAVLLVSLMFMPRAGAALLSNKDLLLPLALVVVTNKLLAWLAAAPILGALLKPSLPLHFFNLGFSLSLHLLFSIALAVAYAAGVTGAVVEFVRTEKCDLGLVLPMALRRVWRILGVMAIGTAVLMITTSIWLLLLPVMGFFALVPLAVVAVAWNFMTAAVLPVAWLSEVGFWSTFRAGVLASLANLGKWWLLLLAQMLLLGLVFFYYSSGGGHTNVNWSINAFWTGGYEDECRWYGKLAEMLHASKLPLVETLLTLLFGGFAVAIKIAIVQRLQPGTPLGAPSAEDTGTVTNA